MNVRTPEVQVLHFCSPEKALLALLRDPAAVRRVMHLTCLSCWRMIGPTCLVVEKQNPTRAYHKRCYEALSN